jgi:hypothetical protein
MARGFIEITNTGLTEIADYLDKLADKYDPIVQESVQAMQQEVVDRIKQNWTSMIGGKAGGYVYDSIGMSTAMSKTDAHVIVGTMGVYHMDSVAGAHGKTPKDLNAAQIAYWIEYGTSRLKGGGRKKKGAEYTDEQLISVAAKPFIGNAFYSSIEDQNRAFKAKFNSLVDELS